MFEVTWSPEVDGTQRAMTVDVVYPNSGVSGGEARLESERFMPTDSQPVETYVASEGQTVEVFFSAALATVLERLESGARDIVAGRLDGQPEGTFIRIAERSSPMTGRLLLAVGNSP
jgi:hypothetical protein